MVNYRGITGQLQENCFVMRNLTRTTHLRNGDEGEILNYSCLLVVIRKPGFERVALLCVYACYYRIINNIYLLYIQLGIIIEKSSKQQNNFELESSNNCATG